MKTFKLVIFNLFILILFVSCDTTTTPNVTGTAYTGYIYYTFGSDVIYRVNLKDEKVEEIVKNASEPEVLPNGDLIAMESGVQGKIVNISLPNDMRKTILQFKFPGNKFESQLHAPKISINKQYIAYDGYSHNPFTYIIDANSGAYVATIGDDSRSSGDNYYNPSWAPDGSLVVQGAPSRNNGLYLISKDFKNITKITESNLTDVSFPNLSPDGKTIVFIRNSELWTINIDGTNPTNLNTKLPTLSCSTWSPDSKFIAVVSNGDIYIVNPKTLILTKLSNKSRANSNQQICWR